MESRKLVFIDNDGTAEAAETVRGIQRKLDMIGLPKDYILNIQVVTDFHRMDRDKAYDILFDKNNAIITWSMFTATHHGSLYQLFSFLAAAGRNNIKDRIYIDTADQLFSALSRNIYDMKNVFSVLLGIERNYIIGHEYSSDLKKHGFFRVRFDLTNDDYFRKEPIDLKEILNVK